MTPTKWRIWCGFVALLGAIGSPCRADETAPKERRIVICLDGTLNNAERGAPNQDGRTIFRPTNVLKTYRSLATVGPDGITQISYYDEGVGALVGEPVKWGRLQLLVDRIVGGLHGGGFDGRVKEAYRFLVGNYQPGDRIYVFGFSRGAAQAQSLVRFMDWIGGVLRREDEYFIPELFDAFRTHHARAERGKPSLDAIRARSTVREREKGAETGDRSRTAIHDPHPATVAFLGVWDTVLSLGSRLGADHSEGMVSTVHPRYAHHVGAVAPANALVVRQALAIDESRWDYRPQVWTSAAPHQSLEQRWFPGVHTQIGGGRRADDALANHAFQWLIGEARHSGLAFNMTQAERYRPGLMGEAPSQAGKAFRVVDALRGKRGRGVRPLDRGPNAKTTISPTALQLLAANPRYRPRNLLDYLRDHPVTLDQLDAAGRAELEKAIPELRSPAQN